MKQTTPQTKHRKCQKLKQALKPRESKRLCIPIDREVYEGIIDKPQWFRAYLDACQVKYPELFPAIFSGGYKCIGYCEQSKKMPEVKLRRVRTKAKNEGGKTETYQIVPCFVMPYMTGYTAEVEKALFLHFKYH